jgi:DNA invertase Pin-like site-specific DNA recombinase
VAPALLRSAKILGQRLDRLAIVYVRQSSPHQVLHHRESRERQYALVERAVALGWPRRRVPVIDDDQGQSGKAAGHRSGFHRLLAEVAIAHVGLVLGLEMSRLARSSKDWHHLLEMCALVGTVLADEDGVYDPNDSNDRLLLGLKGTISEFELVTMRNRLERGKLNEARRGELFYCVPTGYIKVTPEHVEFDLELSIRALELIEQERAALERHWRQRLERARYDSQEAERRYRAVDPENRLVARTLERRWEEALAAERALADAYDRFR